MEDPAILFGVPMIVLGSLGLLLAAIAMVGGDVRTPQEAAGRAGWSAFIGLAWLTAVEYLIAISMSANFFPLVLIAAIKVGLIANYFMHVVRVRRSTREAH